MARDISKTMQSVKSLFFIGIGGISMSGFAELLHDNGFNVCGSDMKESKITKHLSSLGINTAILDMTKNKNSYC